MRRRNPVTRDMIERHRNKVHTDKRRRVMEQVIEELLDPDSYDTSIDEAGNVSINYTGGSDDE